MVAQVQRGWQLQVRASAGCRLCLALCTCWAQQVQSGLADRAGWSYAVGMAGRNAGRATLKDAAHAYAAGRFQQAVAISEELLAKKPVYDGYL